ncbi:putative membrane protein [Vibrio mimicus]|nr:putative membrane protein [Vibrio mimicus]
MLCFVLLLGFACFSASNRSGYRSFFRIGVVIAWCDFGLLSLALLCFVLLLGFTRFSSSNRSSHGRFLIVRVITGWCLCFCRFAFFRFAFPSLAFTFFTQFSHFTVIRLTCATLCSFCLFGFGACNRRRNCRFYAVIGWLKLSFLRFNAFNRSGNGIGSTLLLHLFTAIFRRLLEAIFALGLIAIHSRFFLFKARFSAFSGFRF